MIQNALILLQNVMFTTKWDTYCKNWHYKGHSHTSTDGERILLLKELFLGEESTKS